MRTLGQEFSKEDIIKRKRFHYHYKPMGTVEEANSGTKSNLLRPNSTMSVSSYTKLLTKQLNILTSSAANHSTVQIFVMDPKRQFGMCIYSPSSRYPFVSIQSNEIVDNSREQVLFAVSSSLVTRFINAKILDAFTIVVIIPPSACWCAGNTFEQTTGF